MIQNIKTLFISFLIICVSFGAFYISSSDYEFGGMTDLSGEKIEKSFSQKEIIEKVLKGEKVPFTNYKIANDFFNQKAQNERTIGWLAIPNIGYFPVMFSGDNYFYLKHNQYDQYDPYGALFNNKDSGDKFDRVTYIHGHNDNRGTRLGTMKKYYDSTFFNNNEPVELFDGEYLYYYMPFTIFKREDGRGDNLQGELDLETKREYINKRINDSLVKPDRGLEQLDINNPFIFLSCCATFHGNVRLDVGYYLLQKVKYDPEGMVDFKPTEIELINIFKED